MSELSVPDFVGPESAAFAAALLSFGVRMEVTNGTDFLDKVQEAMAAVEQQKGPVNSPLQHQFTPGLYFRTIEMVAGTLIMSEIHKTEHPFVIHVGTLSEWTEADGFRILHAPYLGVTKPGTRRLLYAHTDTVWSTFHPTTKTDLDEIRKELIMERKNLSEQT